MNNGFKVTTSYHHAIPSTLISPTLTALQEYATDRATMRGVEADLLNLNGLQQPVEWTRKKDRHIKLLRKAIQTTQHVDRLLKISQAVDRPYLNKKGREAAWKQAASKIPGLWEKIQTVPPVPTLQGRIRKWTGSRSPVPLKRRKKIEPPAPKPKPKLLSAEKMGRLRETLKTILALDTLQVRQCRLGRSHHETWRDAHSSLKTAQAVQGNSQPFVFRKIEKAQRSLNVFAQACTRHIDTLDQAVLEIRDLDLSLQEWGNFQLPLTHLARKQNWEQAITSQKTDIADQENSASLLEGIKNILDPILLTEKSNRTTKFLNEAVTKQKALAIPVAEKIAELTFETDLSSGAFRIGPSVEISPLALSALRAPMLAKVNELFLELRDKHIALEKEWLAQDKRKNGAIFPVASKSEKRDEFNQRIRLSLAKAVKKRPEPNPLKPVTHSYQLSAPGTSPQMTPLDEILRELMDGKSIWSTDQLSQFCGPPYGAEATASS